MVYSMDFLFPCFPKGYKKIFIGCRTNEILSYPEEG